MKGHRGMADYYPVIARAIADLPESTEVTRRALYARARSTLSAQLFGRDATDITRERSALEEAIRKVEAHQGTHKTNAPVGSEEDTKAQIGVTTERAQVGYTSTSAGKGNLKDPLYCSFCDKSQHQVQRLIAGPMAFMAFICNECTVSYAYLVRSNEIAPNLGNSECSFCGKSQKSVIEKN